MARASASVSRVRGSARSMICIAPIITADTPSPAANMPAAYQPSPSMNGITAVARASVAVPMRT